MKFILAEFRLFLNRVRAYAVCVCGNKNNISVKYSTWKLEMSKKMSKWHTLIRIVLKTNWNVEYYFNIFLFFLFVPISDSAKSEWKYK